MSIFMSKRLWNSQEGTISSATYFKRKVQMENEMVNFVALCGYPKVGKSEVQRIISQRYCVAALDDSAPLREAAKILYNLDEWHVATQEGKASIVVAGRKRMTVRKALGELGNYLEKNDEFHLPRLAIQKALASDPNGIHCFASVRKQQPVFFRDTGRAIVIEVTRDGCKALEDFDDYDRSCLDFSIDNTIDLKDPNGSIRKLEVAVASMLDPVLPLRQPSLTENIEVA